MELPNVEGGQRTGGRLKGLADDEQCSASTVNVRVRVVAGVGDGAQGQEATTLVYCHTPRGR